MSTGRRIYYTYAEMLSTIGITEEQLAHITASGNYVKEAHVSDRHKFILGPSTVSGLGVACTEEIAAGDVIGLAGSLTHKTILGRYINHSDRPNCKLEILQTPIGFLLYLRATEDLIAMKELRVCYVDNWYVMEAVVYDVAVW
jgi:hypothetical protein